MPVRMAPRDNDRCTDAGRRLYVNRKRKRIKELRYEPTN